jgi:hypothetical protein
MSALPNKLTNVSMTNKKPNNNRIEHDKNTGRDHFLLEHQFKFEQISFNQACLCVPSILELSIHIFN